ncbi:MAG: hypothetical protein ACK41F_03900 [Fimbriimonadaceae bacterium]
MAFAVRWLALLALLGSACARTAEQTGVPAAAEYARLQELSFGFGAVTSMLADCVESADEAVRRAKGKPATEAALRDLRDLLDGAGRTLAEHSEDPPPAEEMARQPGGARSALERALEALEDAAADLEEARNQLLDLQEVAPPSLEEPLQDLLGRIEDALTELSDLRDQAAPTPPAQAR